MPKLKPITHLQPTQKRRFNIGIQEWKNAITSAERIDFAQRIRLYDIYDDMLLDSHLSSVIERRRAFVTSTPITFVPSNGKQPAQQLVDTIAAPWFQQMLKDIVDARFFGFSLFQIDTDPQGWPSARLIPRKHVDPIRRQILTQQTDSHGQPFDKYFNLMLVGDPYDLGLLVKAARYVIYKSNDLGDWAEFAEVFGMPIREYTYDATDDDTRQQVLRDAYNQGAAQVYIHPEGTGLRLIESQGKTGALDIYKGLADFCNAEISKLFLGNTLTTQADQHGTQALGTVQQDSEAMILDDDRRYVLNVLNYQLTDILATLGYPTRDGRFAYADTSSIDPEQQLRILQGLHAMGLPIAHQHLYDTFGIEPPKKSDPQTSGGVCVPQTQNCQSAGSTPANGNYHPLSTLERGAGGEVLRGSETRGHAPLSSDDPQLNLFQRFFAAGE